MLDFDTHLLISMLENIICNLKFVQFQQNKLSQTIEEMHSEKQRLARNDWMFQLTNIF
jgi:hypothetical protein